MRWYGENIQSLDDLKKQPKHYNRMDLLEEKERNLLRKFKIDSKINRKKLAFNSMGLGVFSFPRAAIGLRKVKEYYSAKHKKVVDSIEVVRENDNYKLKVDNSKVVRRDKEVDGKKKYTTSNKTVYAYFIPKPIKRKNVVFYVQCGASSGTKADLLLYNAIAPIIASKILERAGYKVKIVALIGTTNDTNNINAQISVKLKDFGTKANIDRIAMVLAAPEFFRYEGFRFIIAANDYANLGINEGLGYPIMDINAAKEFYSEIETSEKMIFFPIIQSAYEAEIYIKKIINEISNNEAPNN